MNPPASPADLDQLLVVLTALKNGDFSQKLPEGAEGTMGEICASVNELVDRLNQFAGELTRLCREYGTDGRLGGQIELPGARESWLHLQQNVNFMGANLTDQVRNCVEITSRFSDGDLSRRPHVRCAGEMNELVKAINRVGDRLESHGALS